TFAGDFNADSITVGAHLMMDSDQKVASYQNVNLSYAKVAANLMMDGAAFAGTLRANATQVGGHLTMQSIEDKQASFQKVILVAIKVGGSLEMTGATFAQHLDANSATIGGHLLMGSGKKMASFQGVSLDHVKVAGVLVMDGATIEGDLSAEALRVESNLFMRDAVSKGGMSLVFVRVGGSLDLRGTTVSEVDLSGAAVAGDFRLAGGDSVNPVVWQKGKDDKAPSLKLRNARVGNLMDTSGAWPPTGSMQMDGFTFTHLGGYEGDSGPQMRGRSMAWWDQWARRDAAHTPLTYEQLAAALIAAGDRSAA